MPGHQACGFESLQVHVYERSAELNLTSEQAHMKAALSLVKSGQDP